MVTVHGILTGVSVSHQDTDVETIAAVTPADERDRLEELLTHESIEEAFVLCTCNRAEFYVVTDQLATGQSILREYLEDIPGGTWRSFTHEEAIEHLFRITTGLESQVLGEDEIQGQVREAYHSARSVGALGELLDSILLKALHVGERARSETEINEGIVSLASAAVCAVEDHLHLPTSTAVVVGTGDIGTRTSKVLADRGVNTLYLANRTPERANSVSSCIEQAEVVNFEGLSPVLRDAELCITATSSTEPILTDELLPGSTSMLVVDLGQPPDVAPSVRDRASIAYFDLDRLRRVTERTHEQRQSAATAVESIVEEELDILQRRFKREQAETVIAGMRTGAERIKRSELERALTRLEEAESPPDVVLEEFANALVNAIMDAPTQALRDAAEKDDWATIFSAIQIFNPDLEEDDLPPAIAEQVRLARSD